MLLVEELEAKREQIELKEKKMKIALKEEKMNIALEEEKLALKKAELAAKHTLAPSIASTEASESTEPGPAGVTSLQAAPEVALDVAFQVGRTALDEKLDRLVEELSAEPRHMVAASRVPICEERMKKKDCCTFNGDSCAYASKPVLPPYPTVARPLPGSTLDRTSDHMRMWMAPGRWISRGKKTRCVKMKEATDLLKTKDLCNNDEDFDIDKVRTGTLTRARSSLSTMQPSVLSVGSRETGSSNYVTATVLEKMQAYPGVE